MHKIQYLLNGIRNVIKKIKSSKPHSWSTDANKHNFDASQMILNTKLFQLIPSLHFPWKEFKYSVVCLLLVKRLYKFMKKAFFFFFHKLMHAYLIPLIKIKKPHVHILLSLQYKLSFQCFSGCEF